MGHFGLELKYLCILVAVAHSLLMNFSTGTSLAKLSWLIESASRSHATVASFALVTYSLPCALFGIPLLGCGHVFGDYVLVQRNLFWGNPWL